jgi:hypothetical protein
MGRLVLLLLAFLGWAALSHKPARRLYGSSADAFPFPTAAAHSGIDLEDRAIVADWCRRFDCTEEQLRAATKVAGASAEDVRRHLLRPR